MDKHLHKLELQEKKLYEDIRICQIVLETLNSKGWTEIIGPKLTRMIETVCGYQKPDGTWITGSIDNDLDRREWYAGFRAGLIALSNDIYNHKTALESKKERLKNLEKQKTAKPKMPMEDTRYA